MVDKMSIRFGNMQRLVNVGNWGVNTGRGAIDVAYLSAFNATAVSGGGSIRGMFNISQTLNLNTTE